VSDEGDTAGEETAEAAATVPLLVPAGGTPTEPEVAAILAAVEALWPRPVPEAAGPVGPPPWRFSGRWWAKPATARRDRPWFVTGS
jgi:hypothetical protein